METDSYEFGKFICMSEEFKENYNKLNEEEQDLVLDDMARNIAASLKKLEIELL